MAKHLYRPIDCGTVNVEGVRENVKQSVRNHAKGMDISGPASPQLLPVVVARYEKSVGYSIPRYIQMGIM